MSPDTAVDVLTSSLSNTTSSLASARLSLALAEVEARRGSWRAAADAAGVAAEAAGRDLGALPALSVLAAAWDARVRACLIAGWDEEAVAFMSSVNAAAAVGGDPPSIIKTAAAGLGALVAHVGGDQARASGAAAALGGLDEATRASLAQEDYQLHDPDIALAASWAAVRAGAVWASCGGTSSSSPWFPIAARTAAASTAAADLSTCPTGPLARADLAASVGAGLAQLALRAGDCPGAEDEAAASLGAADGAGSPAAAAAAPLLLLGDTFARRAQLTVGVGLYTRAAQGAGLVQPTGGTGGKLWAALGGRAPAVHPSLASAVAWRLAQLLTLAPRRSTEADQWAGVAVRAGGLGPDAAALTAALGPLHGLKGGLVASMGAPWVDVATRRVLPRLE